MSEFPVEPDKLEWLANRPGAMRVGASGLTPLEVVEGVERAELIINAWAKNEQERSFLEALSNGHEIAEACRLSGLSRSRSDALLRRIRGSS